LNIPEPGKWHRTSPFAILFFIGRMIRLLVKNAWQGLAPLLVVALAAGGGIAGKFQVAAIGFSALIVADSILNYWFFRFQVGERSILIREGWLKKKQLDIKFDRIQGINTRQNPIYRWLGLLTVSFDTAGSAGSEGNLPAVTRAFADSLRERIGKGQVPAETDEVDVEAVTQARLLIRLNWRDMIRIGLADRRALVILAFIGPLMGGDRVNIDAVVARLGSIARASGVELAGVSGFSIGLAILLGLVLVFVVISVAAAFLRFHRFKLWLDGQTLRSRGGLLTRHENAMDIGKIQTLRLQQGIMDGWQRRFRMTARQAVASGKKRSSKVFTIPSVTARKGNELRKLFLAPEGGVLSQDPRFEGFTPISPFSMRSKILFIGLLPSLLATITISRMAGMLGLVFLLWLPLVAGLSYRIWKRAGYQHDNEEIVRRSGFLGYRTVGLLFRKVQRVTLTQSRYQRRKGLASLRMHMASGSVRVPYIDHGLAEQLRDYILYKVESSGQSWH